jgi:hypothetical protein
MSNARDKPGSKTHRGLRKDRFVIRPYRVSVHFKAAIPTQDLDHAAFNDFRRTGGPVE